MVVGWAGRKMNRQSETVRSPATLLVFYVLAAVYAVINVAAVVTFFLDAD